MPSPQKPTKLQQQATKEEEREKRKRAIAEIYADFVKDGILFPLRSDLKSVGVTIDTVRHHFGTLSKLRQSAKEWFPDSFKGVIDLEQYLSEKNLKRIAGEIKAHKRFVITTAVSGQPLHGDFLASMHMYCKHNDAKLLILPSHDPAHNLDNEIDWHFDELIAEEDIIFEETRLNSNLFISEIRVTAKQINPVTGLSELSQTKGSFIFASPKQSLEFDSVSANKLPHARMTTGACTLPSYRTKRGNSLRTAYMATFQHVIGALIVEIKDDNIYHFRQVQAAKDGSFCDFGKQYSIKGVKKVKPKLVMGDYHAGEHDDSAVEAWIEMIKEMGIEEVFFHDMFNGVSVNPHEEDDIILKSERAALGLNSIENEMRITAREFDRILGVPGVKKGVVIKSNHDDFIDRWLRKGKFAKDPINFKFGCRLAAEVHGTKKDFFNEGLRLVGLPKNYDKIQWLSVDEDYLVGGINCGAHGDKGANGSRGGIRNLAKSYPKCIVGHSHTPGIFKGVFQVGTTSRLRLGYNKGPSSWVHCSCLVYDNGQRQLVNSIRGMWRLESDIRK